MCNTAQRKNKILVPLFTVFGAEKPQVVEAPFQQITNTEKEKASKMCCPRKKISVVLQKEKEKNNVVSGPSVV